MKKYIRSFIFDRAQYYVSDEKGTMILLKINYKENNFTLEKTKRVSEDFTKEIEEVAEGLLKKKHGVNRVSFL